MNGGTLQATVPSNQLPQSTKQPMYSIDNNNHAVKHLSHRTTAAAHNSDDNSNGSGSSSDFVSDEEYAWIPVCTISIILYLCCTDLVQFSLTVHCLIQCTICL